MTHPPFELNFLEVSFAMVCPHQVLGIEPGQVGSNYLGRYMYLLLGILVKNLKIDVTLHLISVFSIRFIVEADAEGQRSVLN